MCRNANIDPTTLTQSGHYCLANEITNGPITVAASNVDIDLNNLMAGQGIVINSGLGQIAIHNGTVNGGSTQDGIQVNAGTSGITVQDVTIQNAIRGIAFESAIGASIENVTLTQNYTGLFLNNAYKINVSNTIASCNTYAGFELLASCTNSFSNCQALSTGEGNTQVINNYVFGFVSTDGHSNIFENCIANTTIGLSTTDANSLIAGFALRGSESCTKIIASESTNAQANSEGVTVPCGILLKVY